jgi:hypothetical protein
LNARTFDREALMRRIAAAGSTIVPALLTLERLGFEIAVATEGGRQKIRSRCSAW